MAQSAAAQSFATDAEQPVQSAPTLMPEQQQHMARVLSMEQFRTRRAAQTGQEHKPVQDAGAAGKDILQKATGRVPLEQREDEKDRATGLAQSRQATAAGVKAGGVPGLGKAQQLAQGAKSPAQMLNRGRNVLGRLSGGLGGGGQQKGGALQGAAEQVGKVVARQAIMMALRVIVPMLSAVFSVLGPIFLLMMLVIVLILAIEHGLESVGYEGFLDFF